MSASLISTAISVWSDGFIGGLTSYIGSKSAGKKRFEAEKQALEAGMLPSTFFASSGGNGRMLQVYNCIYHEALTDGITPVYSSDYGTVGNNTLTNYFHSLYFQKPYEAYVDKSKKHGYSYPRSGVPDGALADAEIVRSYLKNKYAHLLLPEDNYIQVVPNSREREAISYTLKAGFKDPNYDGLRSPVLRDVITVLVETLNEDVDFQRYSFENGYNFFDIKSKMSSERYDATIRIICDYYLPWLMGDYDYSVFAAYSHDEIRIALYKATFDNGFPIDYNSTALYADAIVLINKKRAKPAINTVVVNSIDDISTPALIGENGNEILSPALVDGVAEINENENRKEDKEEQNKEHSNGLKRFSLVSTVLFVFSWFL